MGMGPNTAGLLMSGKIGQNINTAAQGFDAILTYKKAQRQGAASIAKLKEEFAAKYPDYADALPPEDQYGNDFNAYAMAVKPIVERITGINTGEYYKDVAGAEKEAGAPLSEAELMAKAGEHGLAREPQVEKFRTERSKSLQAQDKILSQEEIAHLKAKTQKEIEAGKRAEGMAGIFQKGGYGLDASGPINAETGAAGGDVTVGGESPAIKVKREIGDLRARLDAAKVANDTKQTALLYSALKEKLVGKLGEYQLKLRPSPNSIAGMGYDYSTLTPDEQNVVKEIKAQLFDLNEGAISSGEIKPPPAPAPTGKKNPPKNTKSTISVKGYEAFKRKQQVE